MKKTVTDLAGVYAGGIHCGIKEKGDDLAFLYVPDAFSSAGTFTLNKFAAPCIAYTRGCVMKNTLRAAIINSGNANAATGMRGLENTRTTAKLAARLLGLKPSEVGVASTGIIGKQLPMGKLTAGLERLLRSPKQRNGHRAARAIMTTDLQIKETFHVGNAGRERIHVAGFCKGSGMIAPNMGTMLGYLVTDLRLPRGMLQRLLREAVNNSFNMTSVDTDTSTNDMVLVFSTGRRDAGTSTRTINLFRRLLTDACQELAQMIAVDGEGATKLIEVHVRGAATTSQARLVALNVVNSPLVKTALHGADPNWGRIVAAAGKDPTVRIDPARLGLRFGDHQIMRKGMALEFDRPLVIRTLKQKKVPVTLDLQLGTASATAWGCDLGKGYIDINTHYS